MTTPVVSFSKGEIAPELYGRIDAAQYTTAAKVARNVIVQRYGGLASRPGFRVVGPIAQQDQRAKLVPYQAAINQAFMLVFQQATAQPLALGGFVLESDDLKIVSATRANPVVLEIPYHAYAVGDRIYLRGLTGMQDLEGRLVTVTAVPDASHVAINVDGTTFDILTDSTGTVRAAPPAPAPPPPPPPPPTPTPTPPPDTGGGGGSGGGFGAGGGGGRFNGFDPVAYD